MSPGHLLRWLSLCRINRSLAFTRKDFNYLCHPIVKLWQPIQIYIYIYISLKNAHIKGYVSSLVFIAHPSTKTAACHDGGCHSKGVIEHATKIAHQSAHYHTTDDGLKCHITHYSVTIPTLHWPKSSWLPNIHAFLNSCLSHWGWHKMETSEQKTYSNELSSKSEFRLKFNSMRDDVTFAQPMREDASL